MKILLPHRPGGAFGYITDGWYNAFRDCGHDVRRWDGNHASWLAFGPDLYLGCSGHKQPIPSKRNCKVAIHVNPYGPVDIEGINESKENIRWVLAQKPDAVFGYGFESDRIIWSYWTKKHDIAWVPMPTGADKTLFKDLQRERANDIVYLGGYWSYKGMTINQYLMPVLRDDRLSHELYGWGDWPSHLSKGILPEDGVVPFLNSGKVAPCISERHTQRHGIDVPERAWKVALCGCLVVHDAVPSLSQQFKSAVISSSPQHFLDMCVHYAKNDSERVDLVNKQRDEVLQEHTYHHRLARLLSDLGFQSAANAMVGS